MKTLIICQTDLHNKNRNLYDHDTKPHAEMSITIKMIKVITTFPPFLKKKETKGRIQNKG